MIKGAGTNGNGQPLLFLGISGENVARLIAGEPILIRAADVRALGLPTVEVVIAYGKTERAILDEVESALAKVKGETS